MEEEVYNFPWCLYHLGIDSAAYNIYPTHLPTKNKTKEENCDYKLN